MTLENLKGQDEAREHVRRLQAYLEELEERGEALPRRAGQPNRTKISKEAGIKNRQVLYTNAECVRLLEDFEREDRKRHLSKLEQSELDREATAKVTERESEMRRTILEQEATIASQARTIAELREKLTRFARVEKLMRETGRLP